MAARADVVKHVAPTQVQALKKPVEIPPWQIEQHNTETLEIQMVFIGPSVVAANAQPTLEAVRAPVFEHVALATVETTIEFPTLQAMEKTSELQGLQEVHRRSVPLSLFVEETVETPPMQIVEQIADVLDS